jgi:hypothetical protein
MAMKQLRLLLLLAENGYFNISATLIDPLPAILCMNMVGGRAVGSG